MGNKCNKKAQESEPIQYIKKKGTDEEMKEEKESHLLLQKGNNFKKNKNVKEIFFDKEDSIDENEESTEDQDELSEIAEVSPNICEIKAEDFIEDLIDINDENELPDEVDEINLVSPKINSIEKEEIEDKKESADNEESTDLPDEVIVIAEASPILSDIKKEDFFEDSVDKEEKNENENQDEVSEIDVVSPNMNCIEKEELKDKKDSIDKNEEGIGSPDEVVEIDEISPNIYCIEKDDSIEDSADKKEEIEHPDEVSEIDVISSNINYIEKEDLKNKTDLIDKNDKSILKPDEVGENAGVSPPICENNKNDNVSIQVQDQPSHFILKKFTLPHRKLNAKMKQLLLFYIYQKKMTESKSSRNDIKENENVILINKDFFEKYFYNEIQDLISEDNKIDKEINDIDINNFSLSSIKNIIIKLDNEKINAINDNISNVNEDEVNSLLNQKEEEVLLIGKKIKIYNDFVVINRQVFANFEKIFKINLEDQNSTYTSFNKDFILKIKNNGLAVLALGHFNKENSSNKISYILDFKEQEDLNNQFPLVYSYGVDFYVSDKLMFERGLENDYISPIFNFENIIGYGYKYEPQINDYRKHDNYIRFLNCENLNNIITLFSYEMLFEERKKSKSFENGKYYLVNQEYLNYIKKILNYNLLSQIISPYEPENVKNLYTFIKKVSNDKLNKYFNFKMEDVIFDENSDNYYMVEPELIVLKYRKEQVLSYDNFLLIDEKSGKAFSDIEQNSHIIAELYFIDKKIIINLPNYLNSSGLVPKCVSLIGDLYIDNCFKIEYILIYITEAARTNHLNSIKNNLKESLRNLRFKNNICSFNFQSSEVTIIKYRKKDNFKLETYFKQRPKIGLNNIGATCYMNSTLQCLTHIDRLVDYFKYDPQIEEIKQDNDNLSSSFKTLVDNLYPNNYLSINNYSPNDFKEKISIMNSLFKGVQANDAKDLINFLIERFHQELNEIKENNSKNNNNNNNSKENDIKIKNTIMKNKMASISLLNNKNNLENNSRNNLINELKKRKQYLNKQTKYFLTNDSSKASNNSFLNSEKKKINLGSNSKNNIKENEKNNNNKANKFHKDTKPTKYIKINI